MSTATPTSGASPRERIDAEQLRRGPSGLGGVGLVVEREIRMKLRSKSFTISTFVILAVVVAGIVIMGFVSKMESSAPPVAVVAGAESLLGGAELDVTTVADRAEGEELLRAGDVDALIVEGGDSAVGLTVIGLESAPSGVVNALTVSPSVELLEPFAQSPILVYLAAFLFGIVFYMAALLFGTGIAQSVVEEKQTRVVEILMSTISVRALLAGKVIGSSILALGQMVLIAGAAGIALALTGQGAVIGIFGPPVIWFLVFFAVGFVLLSALFAATAALVSRQEDVNNAISPVTTLVLIPYILVIVFQSNATVLAALSYVPFSAAVGMPMRLFLGTAEWWEPLLSLAVSGLATVLLIMLAAKIYENSLLRTGSKLSIREALQAS